MIKKIPAKTVEVCDLCSHQAPAGCLTKCVICQKDYCHTCEAIMCGCIHQPQICKKCAGNDKVIELVGKFAHPLLLVLNKRDKGLIRLRRHVKSWMLKESMRRDAPEQ